jgi:hypothetical protein
MPLFVAVPAPHDRHHAPCTRKPCVTEDPIVLRLPPLENNMSSHPPLPVSVDRGATRYTDRDVFFHDQFTLGNSPEIYPAGRYGIEIGDRPYEGNGHTVHVRTSTMLVVATLAGTRNVEVSASDLDAALAADTERHLRWPSENPDRGLAERTGR